MEGLLVESEAERIRKLPKEERDKVLKRAAKKVAVVYRDSKDLIKPDRLTEEFWNEQREPEERRSLDG